ncbi:hypothetical protein ABVK25_011919 [Lepraria finkii]|uniref:Uncharacterized protein n=1 Tax=Lepraria finkii TaxID=1340010 RepID=A0ABR4AJJ0_9LECA
MDPEKDEETISEYSQSSDDGRLERHQRTGKALAALNIPANGSSSILVQLRTRVIEGSNSHAPALNEFWAKTNEIECNRQQFTLIGQAPSKSNGLWYLFWNSGDENGSAN